MAVRLLKIAIPFIWFGMVGAISFMEAPLKFQAPGVTLPLGLGIGRIVFQMLNKIEMVMAVILAAAFLIDRRGRGLPFYLFLLTAGILAVQTFWLLPELDARAELVITGETPPGSNEHIVYIVIEAVKLLALLAIGIFTTRAVLKEVGHET